MIQSDIAIRKLALEGMIDPYDDAQCKPGVISWGQSSYGYDIRVADTFRVLQNPLIMHNKVIDPKSNSWHSCFSDYEGVDHIIIPPNSFALGVSVETLNIPRHILAVCVGKSTYARCGIIVNVTPLEPEWKGRVTMEISNTTPIPAKIYANEGICQVLFFSSCEDIKIATLPFHFGRLCQRSYAEKKGKYQNQKVLTMPKINPY